ncbi:MAG: lasso peptide biosynthesis protein [Pyrinomonadaceae bacterium]|nr:lasso peptide biosynthesis protein [Pyrinomonadaceae bacterium]
MHKSSLTLLSATLLLFCIGHQVHSQQSRVAEREAEWNQYALPQSTFVRHTDPSKAVLFLIPSDWKQQQPDKLIFSAPLGATLTVIVEKIPDGMPLRDYTSALLQQLRSLPDGADSLVVRRTTLSALEAREVMFETSADSEEVSRRIIWCTVSGPNAVSMVLIGPVARAAEIEPYLKAALQSITIVDNSDYAGFEALRSSLVKDPKPQRVDEVQSLAASLATLDGSNRQSSITKLASIFASSPEIAIDLVLDGRPMVRSAVCEAIAQSRNQSLVRFLLRALDDRELFVAEKAARSVAANPAVIDLLRSHSFDWFKIESIARVWPFLNSKNRITILEEVFSRPFGPASLASKPSPKPDASPAKSVATARTSVWPPGAPPPDVTQIPLIADPSRQLNALTLMQDLPASEFKLPLNTILAAKNDTLTTLALQIAWERDEELPPSELLKLLSSSSNDVRCQAAGHLGRSGSVADIKILESHLSKQPLGSKVDPVRTPSDSSLALNDVVQFAISKIRVREQLAIASGEARQQLITKSLADPKLADWIWYAFVRENVDRETSADASQARPGRDVIALPLGENLFPQDVAYYAALPQPEKAIDKLSSAFGGLQLESARSQANFVLILSSLREQLAQELDSPPGASAIAYSGINTKEPIAMARWYALGGRAEIQSSERKAIILRVTDRARFERTLMLYQRSIGNFKGLTDYFSGGVRFLTLLPAFLPLSAKAMLEGPLTPKKETPLVKYSFVGGVEWNGYPIRVVEHRKVDASGRITRDAAYLTYLGDTAVLAPDLASLCDALTRASSKHQTLATNPDFRRMAETPGEAIYLSNLSKLFSNPTEPEISKGKGIMIESGALKISNSTWENQYQIQFSQTDWLKPFVGFQPEQLASPRELLPRGTVAYYFMNFDPVAAWRDWSTDLFSVEKKRELTSIWSIDFEKEVLPELGPECGVAVLGLPNTLTGNWDFPLAVFFKLKSDKLERALASGRLLTGTSAAPGSTPTYIKLGSADLFVIVKGGFLVLANSRTAITALEQKEMLISSRDFSRAAKQSPAGVVAFGGYNLEAAIATIGYSESDPVKTQQSLLISSLANAFHSPNFYATATADAVQGRFSLSMDREGRFSVSELSSLSKEYRQTYAQVETRGVPIQNQERLSSLKLRIRASAAGQIDRLKEDVASTHQIVEKASDRELELKVLPRHSEPKTSLALPMTGAEFAQYLQPSKEIRSDDKTVIAKAREIAGEERDAWKVARKLAEWTYTNIKWKRVDDATAAETLATLEADCLEFSQLYVAMARSLGLPARMVSGLAFSGANFGGHAWVEVYVGDWIELDPTWGTDFVDATHIRNTASGTLLTYASLNLVEFEVLEAPRGFADFQKDPRSLAAKLSQEVPRGSPSALTAALDLALLTDDNTSPGTWDSLSDSERDVMSSAYRRLLLEISSGFRKEKDPSDWRVLSVKENGERAQVLLLNPNDDDLLMKLSLVRSHGAWFLTEILQTDTDLHLISETLRPTIKTLLDRRTNKSARGQNNSEFVRVLLVMQKDAKASIAIADRVLKEDPKNRGLRHLKALALALSEQKEAAIQLWTELAGEDKPFAPALLRLAREYAGDEDKAKQKLAIEFYLRYGEAEPDDPSTHIALAALYDGMGDDLRAEVEHKAALKSDPANIEQFFEFAEFLSIRKRFQEALTVIDGVDQKASGEEDPFGHLMTHLYYLDDTTISEGLALNQPERMNKSATANLYLAYVRLGNGGSLRAIPLLKKAAALKKDWSEPYGAMANGYRTLRNWTAALNAANTAIKLEADYSDAHLSKACALARLGRIREALQSLEKAVELDPDLPETLGGEADLKVLASRAAFKKLLVPRDNKD